MRSRIPAVIFVIFVVIACGIVFGQLVSNLKIQLPFLIDNRESVEISIIYAPESDLYLKQAIDDFNWTSDSGVNPLTKERWKDGEKKIKVTGKSGSSGTIKDEIVNAVNALDTDKVSMPTIFAPSVSHWLQLANFETGKEIFKLEESPATANAPVVIAIWESRLNWIKAKNPGEEIGWEHLLEVFNSPNGWADYTTEPDIRKKVFYGHTDPYISSTALSTLISTYFANAKYISGNSTIEQLTLSDVNNEKVKNGVKNMEKLIKHYSSRTTEFKEYIAQGPSYLDFVALEENDLIFINQGKTEYKPTEKLVALYPKEGTFVHEHPFGIPYAAWVTDEQREAAKVFTQYILSEDVQKKVLENGFRPANTNVQTGYPITTDLGVDPEQPKVQIKAPTPETTSAVQNSWNFVKKRSELYILVDTSGSMEGEKLENAKEAVKIFAEKLPIQNSVGLNSFNNEVFQVVNIDTLETNATKLELSIGELNAEGGTAIYDGLYSTIENLEKLPANDTIRAIVMLSDGQDTSSTKSLNDIVSKLTLLQKSDNPILVIPIAYGADADLKSLNAIARASATRVQIGDSEDIQRLLEVVSSYF